MVFDSEDALREIKSLRDRYLEGVDPELYNIVFRRLTQDLRRKLRDEDFLEYRRKTERGIELYGGREEAEKLKILFDSIEELAEERLPLGKTQLQSLEQSLILIEGHRKDIMIEKRGEVYV